MQSIYNKQHILEAFIDQTPIYKAICISESWLSPEKEENLKISGYKKATSYSRTHRTGGGVCILLQEHLTYKEVNALKDMTIEYVLEVCACELIEENILLITMYWNSREEDVFYNQLKLILNYINNKYSKFKVIIGGDFNIDVLDNNLKTNNFLNFMREYKFSQYIKEPTRVTPTSSTCIDLIFTNFNDGKFFTTVEELGFSDHKGTIIHLNIPNQIKQRVWSTKKRFFNQNNMQKFKLKLNTTNWDEIILNNKNINENYNMFNNTLTDILNECIPTRKIKLQTKHKKYWLTTGIKISCQNKRKLKSLTIKTNNPMIKQYYKHYEKLLKKTVVAAKKIHFKNKILKSDNKVKTMWKVINEKTNKSFKKEKQNLNLEIDKKIISDPKLIANYFNDYFASIGENKIDRHGVNELKSDPVIQNTENSMYLSPVHPREVNLILKNLKSKKSHGIDEFPPILFKYCAEELTYPLYRLINQSFEEGVVPLQLKQALVKPIHKKNSKSDPSNYRPISLLPTASKIFEKTICNRINSFCEKYNLFDECQNGFRKHKSTTLAVYKYVQEILNIIHSKHYAIGILIDMTKAYDKVQFKILLNKLYKIGIRGKAYEWLSSYLSGRQQIVEIEFFNKNNNLIERIRSQNNDLYGSIPQGSVIGCLLFLVYINDLPKIIDGPSILYADDISLLVSYKVGQNLNEKLNATLTKTVDMILFNCF